MSGIIVSGDTSGSVTLSAPAVAGTVTVTLPSTTGTMLTTASATGISGSAISSGTVPEAYGGTGTSTGYYGFKNRIINGAMVIDQRNAGASVTPTNGQFSVDRWRCTLTQASKYSAQQNAGAVTPPVGFTKYLGVTSLSAYSVVTGDVFSLVQPVEGYNTADLGWGTANASAVTVSFKVYSSLTGTFGGGIQSDSGIRSYPFSYSIPVANTWTTISITIAGDTSGTWLTTNGAGLYLCIALGAGTTYSGTAGAWATANYYTATGATSVVGTNGATFYITGVQLEKGSTATSFDYRPYGTELALCQRYFQEVQSFYGLKTASGYTRINIALPVSMRVTPSISYYDAVGNTSRISTFSSGDAQTNNRTPISVAGASSLQIQILPNNTDADTGYLFNASMSAEL